MEIALLSSSSLRLKGKQATFVVNPSEKTTSYTGALLLGNVAIEKLRIDPNATLIEGPGDYEIGGIKFSATRFDTELMYSIVIDDVSILLIESKTLTKAHQKMQDHDIVVVYLTTNEDPSVAANVANSVVLYFGTHAKEAITQFIKEGVQEMNKYVITKDKLPTEVVQTLLV